MAEFSIDQKKLPGVKEVCRDFAVLEDHCLAHNLQEQEIESHLASNVHKSRLVQQDLQVAKRMQEEEDLRAKAQSKKQYRDIERQDNEIAQEIQEELVRQAELQRRQEEKDAAIARKLQEKEMKEERRRQKQIEANFEEEFYEGQVGQDKPKRLPPPSSSHHEDYVWPEPSRTQKQSRFKPGSPPARSRYPRHDLPTDPGDPDPDPYLEHRHPSRGKPRHMEHQDTEVWREKEAGLWEEGERAVRRRERPPRPAPPQFVVERNQEREREHAGERRGERPRNIDREFDLTQERRSEREGRRDGGRVGEPKRHKDRENDRLRSSKMSWDGEGSWDDDPDRLSTRTRSRDRLLLESAGPSQARAWRGEEEDVYEDRTGCVRGTLEGNEWEEHRSGREGRRRREENDPYGDVPRGERSLRPPLREPGHAVQGGVAGGAAVLAGGEYGVGEATQGLTRLELRELREQELRDMEVARKMQEEEIKASKIDKRAAQVAQDEEIARLLMEQEKKEYKKSREKEKEKERLAMERRRPEGDYKPSTEEVVRPRSREEYEYQRQKNHNKPDRPPRPRTPEYENVNPGSGYSENPFTPRVPSRPEAAYKGVYYRQ